MKKIFTIKTPGVTTNKTLNKPMIELLGDPHEWKYLTTGNAHTYKYKEYKCIKCGVKRIKDITIIF